MNKLPKKQTQVVYELWGKSVPDLPALVLSTSSSLAKARRLAQEAASYGSLQIRNLSIFRVKVSRTRVWTLKKRIRWIGAKRCAKKRGND